MRKGKQIISILLIIVLAVTGMTGFEKVCAAEAGGVESSEELSFSKVEGTKKLEELTTQLGTIGSSSRGKDIGYSPEDMADVIVELKDASLLENYTYSSQMYRSRTIMSFEDYVTSSTGKDIHQQLIENQNTVLDKINELNAGRENSIHFVQKGNSISAIYNYTSVLNGFSIRIPYELLEDIKKLPEVKMAYVAPVYDLIKPTMSQSVPFIGADKAWLNTGYKGEGTVVAVVDTGLDTSHEAFHYTPNFTKLTQGSIENILAEADLSAEKYGDITSENVYLSPKLPYVFDYADKDTVVSGGNSHGTHVAGTIAGSALMVVEEDGAITYKNGVVGVAPEAQLVIMKVFSDSEGGASTVDIIAALDDAVKLGVDVINMSLGAAAGYTYESGQGIDEIYNRITEAGINLVTAAGNEYSMSNGNTYGAALASNPDTATVGSPSAYESALSVASVINKGVYIENFKAGGQFIEYTDKGGKGEKLVDKLFGPHEYVEAGLGREEDYANVDVTGKIALVQRGSISFNEKEVNAVSGGAIGLIVYNNQPGTINMAIDQYEIPAVSVTLEQGEYLKGLQEKIITVDPEYNIELAGHASDFSSWGVTPDLKLKPEIAAPGEGIYSAVAGGYASYNGTSMASPHIAGAVALMKQYVKESFGYLAEEQQQILINQLLMSTAKPMNNFSGLPYSPRKQGAGMVQIYNALTSGAYLYVDNSDRSKIELGDDVDKTGVYNLEFHVKNVTGSAITYNLDVKAITEDIIAAANNRLFIAESPRTLTPDISVNAYGGLLEGAGLIVEPGEDVKVVITVELSQEDKIYLDQNFENGQFIEGFVYLNSPEDVNLSIPFMGYYGDWTKAPIMDSSSLYENGEYSQTASEAYTFVGNNAFILGMNLFASEPLPFDENKIAISPNNDGYFDGVYAVATSLLRNAKTLDYRVTSEGGEEVYYFKSEYERKSFYNSDSGNMYYTLHFDTWNGLDETGTSLPNNSIYNYKITGTLDYDKHDSHNLKDSWVFPVTIDTQYPEITKGSLYLKDGKRYFKVEVKDNQYVSAIALYNSDFSQEIGTQYLNEPVRGQSSIVTFDITNYPGDHFAAAVIDYALNESDYLVDNSVKSISLNKEKLVMLAGKEAALTVTITPEHSYTDITWSSTDPQTATVVNGTVKALKTGKATITAATSNGLTAACEVTVVDKLEPIVELSGNEPFYTGNTRNVIVTMPEELEAELQSITFKSSNKKVASVSKDGVITANRAGKVTITTTIKFNKIKRTYKHTLKVTAPYIEITNGVRMLRVNKTYTFKAESYGTEGDITWSVSNSKYAVINKDTGELVTKKRGIIVVTAKVKNVKDKILIVII